MTKPIYFDCAAATPLADEVVAAMKPYFQDRFYNPSATYLAARQVKIDIEAARSKIAHWLGARPSEIVFTAGGTEANNLAIQGVMRQFPDGHVIVSAVEHDSVLAPAKQFTYSLAPVTPDGRVDIPKLRALIQSHTVLVSIMYANNEIGTIEPIREVAALLREVRADRRQKGNKTPLYLHTDACQAGSYLDLHVSRLGVDLLTLNGGKIYGPKQSGGLFIKTGTLLSPQILGGGQERNWRSGTENVAAIIGLATAIDLVQNRRETETKRLQTIQKLFIEQLKKAIPVAVVNGSLTHRLPNNIHLTIPGQDNERLMMALDEKGIQCAVGSACSASNDEPSHVLKAIGLSDEDAQASLRFTMGRDTTKAAVGMAVKVLADSL